MVTVFCKEQGDRRVRRAVGWLLDNGIEYQIKELNGENFSYETFEHFLKMTVEGIGEILSKRGDGRRTEVLEGELLDYRLTDLYEVFVEDPYYLDLPLMIDERGRTATLGSRRDNKEYENLTVFRETEPILLDD